LLVVFIGGTLMVPSVVQMRAPARSEVLSRD
jgi:hypothetical protein